MNKNSDFIFESNRPEEIKINEDIKIKTAINLKDLKEFYNLAFYIYKDNNYWVAPFWSEIKNFFSLKNPFWGHSEGQLFIAYKNNKAVGRIAAIIDHNFPDEKNKVGFFGFFECINDKKIALSLFEIAEKWLKSKKINLMQGPINGRVDIGSGFVIKGFDSIPYLIGNYNPEYYENFAVSFNMKKARDLVSYHIDLTKPIPENVKNASKRCEELGVKIRTFNKWNFKKDLQLFFDLLLEIFSDHYGYTPSNFMEFLNTFGAKYFRIIVNPKLFLFAEINGEAVGFRFSLPDFNPMFKKINSNLNITGLLKFLWLWRKLDRGRFIVMGIKKEHQGKSIGTCMNYYTLLEMKRKGYKSAEYGWIDEDNIASRRAGEKMGGKIYKIYRVYEKNIVDKK